MYKKCKSEYSDISLKNFTFLLSLKFFYTPVKKGIKNIQKKIIKLFALPCLLVPHSNKTMKTVLNYVHQVWKCKDIKFGFLPEMLFYNVTFMYHVMLHFR